MGAIASALRLRVRPQEFKRPPLDVVESYTPAIDEHGRGPRLCGAADMRLLLQLHAVSFEPGECLELIGRAGNIILEARIQGETKTKLCATLPLAEPFLEMSTSYNDVLELPIYGELVSVIGAVLELFLVYEDDTKTRSLLGMAALEPGQWLSESDELGPFPDSALHSCRAPATTLSLFQLNPHGNAPPCAVIMTVMFAPPALRQKGHLGLAYHELKKRNSARVGPPIMDPNQFPGWVRAYLDRTVPQTAGQALPSRETVYAVRGPNLVSLGSREGGHRVVRVAKGVLVKADMPYALSEASSMKFVADRTAIRVPRFLDGDKSRIMMEEADGCSLDMCLGRMTLKQVYELSHLLKRHLEDLHGLKLVGAKLGQVDGKPYRNQTIAYGLSPEAAFETVEAFHAWLSPLLVEALGLQDAADVISRLPTTEGRFLVHGDLQPKNIFIKVSEADSGGSSMELTIIDWGSSAIFPSRSWEWAGMILGMSEVDYGGKWHIVLRTLCAALGKPESQLSNEVDAVVKVQNALLSFQ